MAARFIQALEESASVTFCVRNTPTTLSSTDAAQRPGTWRRSPSTPLCQIRQSATCEICCLKKLAEVLVWTTYLTCNVHMLLRTSSSF